MCNVLHKSLFLFLLAGTAVGCAADVEDEEDIDETESALRDGVNSSGCKRSPYNCGLHPEQRGQRVLRADGGKEWAVDPAKAAFGVPVLDGNGDPMGMSKYKHFTLNYGQTRRMNGRTYVIALSTGLKAAGWVPIDVFENEESLRKRVGEVNARGDNLKKMACYEVKDTYPARLDNFKVVKGATDDDAQEPDDYLPVTRANGKKYMNLAFNVPGNGLGGPSIDIYPVGTKFQRVDVPTWENPDRPSIDARLYAKPPGSNKYTRRAGEMKFVYGYVKGKLGAVRYGWMALDGLKVSRNCPDR